MDSIVGGAKLRAHPGRCNLADRVADLDVGKPPELRHCAGGHRRALNGGTSLEDGDGGHLALEACSEMQSVARSDRSGEHPGERDLLAVRSPLDLEDGRGDRIIGIALRRGEQLGESGHDRLHARTRHRGAEVDRVHDRTFRLHRERRAQLGIGDGRVAVDVRPPESGRRARRRAAVSRARKSTSAGPAGVKSASRVPSARRTPSTRPTASGAGKRPPGHARRLIPGDRSC